MFVRFHKARHNWAVDVDQCALMGHIEGAGTGTWLIFCTELCVCKCWWWMRPHTGTLYHKRTVEQQAKEAP